MHIFVNASANHSNTDPLIRRSALIHIRYPDYDAHQYQSFYVFLVPASLHPQHFIEIRQLFLEISHRRFLKFGLNPSFFGSRVRTTILMNTKIQCRTGYQRCQFHQCPSKVFELSCSHNLRRCRRYDTHTSFIYT